MRVHVHYILSTTKQEAELWAEAGGFWECEESRVIRLTRYEAKPSHSYPELQRSQEDSESGRSFQATVTNLEF